MLYLTGDAKSFRQSERPPPASARRHAVPLPRPRRTATPVPQPHARSGCPPPPPPPKAPRWWWTSGGMLESGVPCPSTPPGARWSSRWQASMGHCCRGGEVSCAAPTSGVESPRPRHTHAHPPPPPLPTGSYCVFDGASGHGVLDSTPRQGTRATLLVNWWAAQPAAVKPLTAAERAERGLASPPAAAAASVTDVGGGGGQAAGAREGATAVGSSSSGGGGRGTEYVSGSSSSSGGGGVAIEVVVLEVGEEDLQGEQLLLVRCLPPRAHDPGRTRRSVACRPAVPPAPRLATPSLPVPPLPALPRPPARSCVRHRWTTCCASVGCLCWARGRRTR